MSLCCVYLSKISLSEILIGLLFAIVLLGMVVVVVV